MMTSVSMVANKWRAIVGLFLLQLIILGALAASSAVGNNPTAQGPTTKPNVTAPTTAAATAATTTKATTKTSTMTPASSAAPEAKATTTTAEPSGADTMRTPSEQEISEARKIIQEVAASMKEGANRVDKPVQQAPVQDFAPDSPEARVADATTRFGLNFINNLAASPRENIVVSPVSLQILLNIVLLGCEDHSATQTELAKVLGYELDGAARRTGDRNETDGQPERLRPHAAMNKLIESISQATHSMGDEQQQLYNSNPQLAAHLHTTPAREGAGGGQVNFTLANLMLTNQDRIKVNQNYEDDLKRFYDIKLEHFSKPNSTSASNHTVVGAKPLHERINSWVQNATQNQIGELVKQADVESDDLVMVLLNAAHFKGRWLHTFSSKLTHERLFYNEGLKSAGLEAKFMRQSGVFGYAEFGSSQMLSAGELPGGQQTSTSDETVLTEDVASSGRTSDKGGESAVLSPPVIELSKEEARRFELTAKLNCSVLMLPFALNDGQELSMVILLPSRRDGLQELLANLNGPALNEIYKSLNEQHVQVELPKFSFESSLDAKTTLVKMGAAKIFQDGAELGRLLAEGSAKNLAKVDKVVHKARITVDEDGAEAAAASAATIVLRNLIRPPNPTFVADHPFAFVIRHNRSNLPLFMGAIQSL